MSNGGITGHISEGSLMNQSLFLSEVQQEILIRLLNNHCKFSNITALSYKRKPWTSALMAACGHIYDRNIM